MEPAVHAEGERLLERANFLTDFRCRAAPFLGIAIAVTDENLPVTVAVGTTMATDMQDGRDARKGARLLGIPTPPEGAEKDPAADKALVNGITTGLFGRFARQKDFGSMAILGTNIIASQWRDIKMTENRQRVKSNNLDPETLKALPINKLKTALQMSACIIALQSKNRRTRHKALRAFTAGTIIGILGERQYRKHIDTALATD